MSQDRKAIVSIDFDSDSLDRFRRLLQTSCLAAGAHCDGGKDGGGGKDEDEDEVHGTN
jgi:hypothetical protein